MSIFEEYGTFKLIVIILVGAICYYIVCKKGKRKVQGVPQDDIITVVLNMYSIRIIHVN